MVTAVLARPSGVSNRAWAIHLDLCYIHVTYPGVPGPAMCMTAGPRTGEPLACRPANTSQPRSA